MCSHSSIHGSNAADKSNTKHKPRARGHEPKAPAVHVQCARRDTNHTNAKSSVHESVVEVCALKRRHAAILARLPVEDEIDADQRCAEDSGTIEEALSQVALRNRVVCSLLVPSAKDLAEGGYIVRRRCRGLRGTEEVRVLLEWRVVEGANYEGLR